MARFNKFSNVKTIIDIFDYSVFITYTFSNFGKSYRAYVLERYFFDMLTLWLGEM